MMNKIQISKNLYIEVSENDKKLVRERIKKSKSRNLLDWDKVKNNFNGI